MHHPFIGAVHRSALFLAGLKITGHSYMALGEARPLVNALLGHC